jgi:type I restriction-modification system DNA methylase subunit
MKAATAIDVSETKVSLNIAVVELFTQYFTGTSSPRALLILSCGQTQANRQASETKLFNKRNVIG